MALKSTVFKIELQIADMDRHYYASHLLTLARHPSETDERMMVRVLAFALYASETLTFAQGLSTDNEPDLWQKDLTGSIDLWIDVGQPDERDIRKACGRAKQVVVVCYGRVAPSWWNQCRDKLERLKNLTIINLPIAQSQALIPLANRSMQLHCTIQEGQINLVEGKQTAQIEPVIFMGQLQYCSFSGNAPG